MKERILTVIDNRPVADNIYEMTLTGDIEGVHGGQFVHIEIPSDSRVLRRPFGVSDYSVDPAYIKIVYAILGEGTRLLSKVVAGTRLACLLGLGNGFPVLEQAKKIVLLGGGMGSVVFPALARELTARGVKIYTYLGFATVTKATCVDTLTELSEKMVITTDDGSYGMQGFATDLLKADFADIEPDAVFCCGPAPMFKALKALALPCETYISLEERMGCGVGACLTCSCKIKTDDGDKYLRVCADGPVFPIEKVVL